VIEYCGECKHLSITEKSQDQMTYKNIPHVCKKYNEIVRHFKKHPLLPRLEICKLEARNATTD
jgi:hypothetical protein